MGVQPAWGEDVPAHAGGSGRRPAVGPMLRRAWGAAGHALPAVPDRAADDDRQSAAGDEEEGGEACDDAVSVARLTLGPCSWWGWWCRGWGRLQRWPWR